MSIVINNDKLKMKRENITCSICNKKRLCIRTRENNICRPCWKKNIKKEYLWCICCHICGHLSDEDTYKTCSECEKDVGECCGRLYHCQSTECICKKCYDFKCNNCDTILSKNKVYLSDASLDSEEISLCDACKMIIMNEINYDN